MDFACTCPIQQKYVRQASQTLAFACNQYAQVVKYDVYQDRVISEGHSYLSFVFESFGGTSGDSHEFIKKLISSISIRLSEPKSVVANSLYQKISCILMRSLARSLISRFPEFSLA